MAKLAGNAILGALAFLTLGLLASIFMDEVPIFTDVMDFFIELLGGGEFLDED